MFSIQLLIHVSLLYQSYSKMNTTDGISCKWRQKAALTGGRKRPKPDKLAVLSSPTAVSTELQWNTQASSTCLLSLTLLTCCKSIRAVNGSAACNSCPEAEVATETKQRKGFRHRFRKDAQLSDDVQRLLRCHAKVSRIREPCDLFNPVGEPTELNLIPLANQVASQLHGASVPAVSGYQTRTVLREWLWSNLLHI